MAFDMDRWKRLAGIKGKREPEPVAVISVAAAISREEMVPIVGESNYQPAIRSACGWSKPEDICFECMAELVPEPSNPHDPNAVRVDIDGRCVGYLSREHAAELGPAIAEGIKTQGTGMCRAVIAGHKDGETANLGVFLHLQVTRS
jgi:hypothetical protein